jgi:hypothetical protein
LPGHVDRIVVRAVIDDQHVEPVGQFGQRIQECRDLIFQAVLGIENRQQYAHGGFQTIFLAAVRAKEMSVAAADKLAGDECVSRWSEWAARNGASQVQVAYSRSENSRGLSPFLRRFSDRQLASHVLIGCRRQATTQRPNRIPSLHLVTQTTIVPHAPCDGWGMHLS